MFGDTLMLYVIHVIIGEPQVLWKWYSLGGSTLHLGVLHDTETTSIDLEVADLTRAVNVDLSLVELTEYLQAEPHKKIPGYVPFPFCPNLMLNGHIPN